MHKKNGKTGMKEIPHVQFIFKRKQHTKEIDKEKFK